MSMASHLPKAEEPEWVFNGKGRWNQVHSVLEAKNLMNHLFNLASSSSTGQTNTGELVADKEQTRNKRRICKPHYLEDYVTSGHELSKTTGNIGGKVAGSGPIRHIIRLTSLSYLRLQNVLCTVETSVEEKGLIAEIADKIETYIKEKGPPLALLSKFKEGSAFLKDDGSVDALNDL
ncbi:Kinesin-like protein KIN-4C [Glycine soja]|uniref:Kinesin-like protein KIN-4C n=1 Tax=Glycine soja TaxID=3848 RepID=A0A445GF94_GLYSO|nr:Kinesin-like protein KIN-4C [Glycine soja]